MKPFKITVILLTTAMIFSCMTGCHSKSQEDSGDFHSSKEVQTEKSRHSAKDDLYTPGTSLPKGARKDSRGYIIMPGGDTFDQNGGWQVPEGGHTDSKGRIYDKNGNLMGGGVRVGSKS